MLKFSQKNQHFSTLDLFLMTFLVGGVFTFFGAVLAQGFQDNRLARAQSSAEAYAIQLVEQQMKVHRTQATSDVRASRGIASVQESGSVGFPANGTIGRDPWGKPFRYRIVSPSGEMKRKVIVWSDGPNRRSESSLDSPPAQIKSWTFGGDDVGFIQEETLDL